MFENSDLNLGEVITVSAPLPSRGRADVKQWLIHWKGRAIEKARWEEEFGMCTQFPALRLGDKFVSKEAVLIELVLIELVRHI